MEFLFDEEPERFSLGKLLLLFVFASIVFALVKLCPLPVVFFALCVANGCLATYSWRKGWGLLCSNSFFASVFSLLVSRPGVSMDNAFVGVVLAAAAQMTVVAEWMKGNYGRDDH